MPSPSDGDRSILIRDGCVLTLDRSLGDFSRADILVRGPRIEAIGPQLAAEGAEIIDASHSIVMPGFVDTHRHLWQGLLRNILPDVTLEDYFRIVSRTFGPAYTADDAYWGTLVSALGAIDAGITNILDWSAIQNTPEHTEATISALRDSGIRAVFAYGNPASPGPRFWEDPRHRYPKDIIRLRKEHFSSEDQLTTLFLASIAGPQDRLAEAWRFAREIEAPISIHVGVGMVTKDIVTRDMLKRIGDAGLMGPDVTYIHCCTLSDTEWKYIRDTGGTISISSYVEMVMGQGRPPIQKALDLGIRPSLSVDVETSVPGDMFTQMRTILALQRNAIWERRLAGEQELPPALTARDVLEFATIEGARANKLDHKIGTLVPGKEADLILLRTDRIDVLPINNPIGAVVAGMHPGHVDTVMIGGRIKKRHGRLVGFDLPSVSKEVETAQKRVLLAAGQ